TPNVFCRERSAHENGDFDSRQTEQSRLTPGRPRALKVSSMEALGRRSPTMSAVRKNNRPPRARNLTSLVARLRSKVHWPLVSAKCKREIVNTLGGLTNEVTYKAQ